jgi:hypothetical protein
MNVGRKGCEFVKGKIIIINKKRTDCGLNRRNFLRATNLDVLFLLQGDVHSELGNGELEDVEVPGEGDG